MFIHDAICYMLTEEDLLLALSNAYLHTRPGGSSLFVPDYVRERFHASTNHGGQDGGGRGLRYLEWTWDPDPDDQTYTVDYALLLRERDGSIKLEHDRHIEGLFSRAVWLRSLTEVGYEATVVSLEESGSVPATIDVFVGRRLG